MRRGLVLVFLAMAAPAAALDCGLFEAIEPGDTLSGIAARCEVPLERVLALNPDLDPRDLAIGGVVRVGGDETAGSDDPRGRYLADFVGAYAPDATCFGEELQVDLTSEAVFLGETGCRLDRVSAEGARLFLDLSSCSAEGEPAPDRTYEVLRTGPDTIQLGGRQLVMDLTRCTDR